FVKVYADEHNQISLNNNYGNKLQPSNSLKLKNSEFFNSNQLRLPETWEVLGPFPIGSREIGADPLSAYGGFEYLAYSETARFPSELADEGFVKWRKEKTQLRLDTNGNFEEVVGPIIFDNVRWEFNREAFGWIALHHVIYFRGEFTVNEAGVYLVTMAPVTSFKIDTQAFIGNLYQYDHVSSSAIYLAAGVHTLYVQTVMDIRIFGASIPPKVHFTGKFVPLSSFTSSHGVIMFPNDSIFPEITNPHQHEEGEGVSKRTAESHAELATNYASITVMNANVHFEPPLQPRKKSSEEYSEENSNDNNLGWVQVIGVEAEDEDGRDVGCKAIPSRIPNFNSIKLAPGQPYPVPIEFFEDEISNIDWNITTSITVTLHLISLDSMNRFKIKHDLVKLKRKDWGAAYKITFMDYDGSIQYAMAKPPIDGCATSNVDKCPVILALHGSGVEAFSEFWVDSFNRQEQAWVRNVYLILYPSGRTTWGFDWHGPSQMNIQEALKALVELPGVPDHLENELLVDKNKLIYSGHSNGGQGAWWLVSHFPDLAVAALPAAAYMKIQIYTPYYLRVGDAFADSSLRGIMESSISEHDIDMYSSNLAGIPILARSGGSDDNVHPLHNRRMIRLVNEWARDPSIAKISEIPTQGHWFDGVMNDDVMQQFLDGHLIRDDIRKRKLEGGLIDKEKITIPNLPKLGQIKVHQMGDKWVLNTTNVRRFGFVDDVRRSGVKRWVVDGNDFIGSPVVGPSYLRNDGEEIWKISTDLLWLSKERHPNTYGPAISILNHPFLIVIPSNPKSKLGSTYKQVARHLASSWYLYGRGGTQIVQDVDVLDGLAARYNMIVLGGPEDNAWTRRRDKEATSL
ncbi:hypothetical protein HK096_003514, partial [Nowakowskiella sp. JEL0078]